MLNWKPIETAPKDGRIILISCREKVTDTTGNSFAFFGRWDKKENDWSGFSVSVTGDYTHWCEVNTPAYVEHAKANFNRRCYTPVKLFTCSTCNKSMCSKDDNPKFCQNCGVEFKW